MHERSDIDLAILHRERLSALKRWKLSQDLAVIAGRDIDLVDLNQVSTVMRMQVISEGKSLLCQDTQACSQFEDFVFSDYARLNEERADILKDIRQQGVIYG